MITPKGYLQGRDKEYPLTPALWMNLADFLARLNFFFGAIGLEVSDADISSGYRPGKYNLAAKGAPNSGHTLCIALDLKDVKKIHLSTILANEPLAVKLGLHIEDPAQTKTWTHIDCKPRKNFIFLV